MYTSAEYGLVLVVVNVCLLTLRSVRSAPIITSLEPNPVLPPLEWFGEPRGGNPDDRPFYDLSYDEKVCPTGLRSSGLHDFVYTGAILKTLKNTNGTDDCLRQCFVMPDCKSVNVYTKKTILCELNSGDQFDDPLKLVKTPNTLYFDRIHCTKSEKS